MSSSALLGCLALGAQASEDYVDHEVLIKWKELPADVGPVTAQVSDVDLAVQLLAADPAVEYVEPNYHRYLSAIPDDLYYASQWHLEQTSDFDLDMEAAWDISTGSRDIVVAVVDTGIDLDHPDLITNLWTNSAEVADNGIDDDDNGYVDDVNGWDFRDDDNNPTSHPVSGSASDTYVLHGTHVAGLIGAEGNNATGVAGVNWEVSLMPLKIFSDHGQSDISDVTEAIEYAVANGADVINMSYGGYDYSRAEEEALAAAQAAGLILVAAAGNDAINLEAIPSYPVCFDDVIGVGATDQFGATASFSNYGSDCVDVAAPGDTILSTYYTDDDLSLGFTSEYGYMSGTSMATPIVSGLAALLLSVDPTLTNTQVSDVLVGQVSDLGLVELGSGQVNATNAVTAVDVSTVPNVAAVIAYHSSKKQKTVTEGERTKDAIPYFHWDEPISGNEIAGYYVYFGQEKADPVTNGTMQTNRYYVPTTLSGNERTYRLRLKVLDSDGHLSNLEQFEYVVDRTVNRPTWRSAVAGSDANRLKWYKPGGEHVKYYQVFRSKQRHGTYQNISGKLSQRSFVDTNIIPGERYYYTVRAVDDLGNKSDNSTVMTIKL